MTSITVPTATIPVLTECDVLVCGGGSAGVAAAVAAARHGASVVLLERWPAVGGMATAALVTCLHRSDREKVVIHGLAQETVERLERGNWIWLHVADPHVHETEWFEPEGMKIVWHRMLDEAGVRTFCYTPVGEPIVEGGCVRGVLADTKLGRRAFLGRVVIDATGDADVAAKAGVPFSYGRQSDGRVQGMTMMYRIAGVDDARRRTEINAAESKAIREEMLEMSRDGRLPPFNPNANPAGWCNRCIPNMSPVSGNALDEEELTRLTVRGREQVHRYWEYVTKRVPGFEDAYLEQTGFSLGIRESRRIHGRKTLDREMVLGAVKQSDALGHGVWMIDIHDPRGTGYTTWSDRGARNMVPQGQSYHIPLGMCLNREFPNLAVVGRPASSTHEGHSSVRVMSHCMVMGQGVGTAAALALQAGVPLAEVGVRQLHAALRADGVYLEDVPEPVSAFCP